jgi:hypothetical protein
MSKPLLLAKASSRPIQLLPSMANRHGLIAGATGTGKSVTLRVLAEGFSRIGVPVFMADVKGDLAGLSQPGAASEKVNERIAALGIEGWNPQGYPVVLWDVFGKQGHPVRTTISEIGPVLLARLLALNETQAGVLTEERAAVIEASTVHGVYEKAVDRESAYEILKKRMKEADNQSTAASAADPGPSGLSGIFGGGGARSGSSQSRQGPLEAMMMSIARAIGTQIGRSVSRGLFGSLSTRSRRR